MSEDDDEGVTTMEEAINIMSDSISEIMDCFDQAGRAEMTFIYKRMQEATEEMRVKLNA